MLFFLAAVLACTALIFRSLTVLLVSGIGLVTAFTVASLSQASFTFVNLLIAIAGFNGAIMASILLLMAFHSKGQPSFFVRCLPRFHGLTR